MSNFGALTDHFGFADTDWRLQSTSKTARSENAQCENSFGDVEAEKVFDTGNNFECVYEVIKGQVEDTASGVEAGEIAWPATLKGGTIVGDTGSGIVITGATVETSQTERPRVTVTGEDIGNADSTGFAVYDFDLPSIKAVKQAQAMGFTPGGNTRVTSATLSCTVEMAATQDSQGERVAGDVHGGRVEGTGDLVACDTEPTATADTGFELSGPIEVSQENTDYGTASISVFKNILRDT